MIIISLNFNILTGLRISTTIKCIWKIFVFSVLNLKFYSENNKQKFAGENILWYTNTLSSI